MTNMKSLFFQYGKYLIKNQFSRNITSMVHLFRPIMRDGNPDAGGTRI